MAKCIISITQMALQSTENMRVKSICYYDV